MQLDAMLSYDATPSRGCLTKQRRAGTNQDGTWQMDRALGREASDEDVVTRYLIWDQLTYTTVKYNFLNDLITFKYYSS